MPKQEIPHHVNQLYKIAAQTSIKKEEVPWDDASANIFRDAADANEVHKYSDEMFFSCHKTTYKDGRPCIMFIFTLKLEGPSSGSSKASSYIMELMKLLESKFSPWAYSYFDREIDSKNDSVGIIKFLKYID